MGWLWSEDRLGLFCKRAIQKRQYSAKETYNLIDATARSRPVPKRIVFCNIQVQVRLQGGEDAHDALSLEVIFRERALYLVAHLWKETCNLRHPMHPRHPVHIIYVTSRISHHIHITAAGACVA